MLGRRVLELREARDLTQGQVVTQMASRHGVSIKRGYLSKIETGTVKLPGPDIVAALADVLGATDADLLMAAGYIRTGPSGFAPDLTRRMDRLAQLEPNMQGFVLGALDAMLGYAEMQQPPRPEPPWADMPLRERVSVLVDALEETALQMPPHVRERYIAYLIGDADTLDFNEDANAPTPQESESHDQTT